MKPFHPDNETIKHRYFRYLEHAKGLDQASIDKIAEHLLEYESFSKFAAFTTFNDKVAVGFREYLAERRNLRTGKPWAKTTVVGHLTSVRRFFEWVSREPGYRSRIRTSDVAYLNPNLKDSRIANARIEALWPTEEQAKHAFLHMSESGLRERRDKAIFALMMLTGIRVTAALSLCLKSVDVVTGCIHQYGREVSTKFGKSFDSFFCPVDSCFREYFIAWIKELREVHLFGHADPVFPKLKYRLANSDGSLPKTEPTRLIMRDENPVRQAIQGAFEAQGLPRFRLHSFRNTLTFLGSEVCSTAEEFKAWSQNFGHESVHTTIDDYMPVPPSRRRELFARMRERRKKDP